MPLLKSLSKGNGGTSDKTRSGFGKRRKLRRALGKEDVSKLGKTKENKEELVRSTTFG